MGHSLNTSNTQRGETYILECHCGIHMLRFVRNSYYGLEREHIPLTIEFWEYVGDTGRRGFWSRLCLALNIILGREGKYPAYDVEVLREDLPGIIALLTDCYEEKNKK